MIPTLFGFPIYFGCKRRVGKKRFRRYWRCHFPNENAYQGWLKDMSQIKVGDLVSACSVLNEKITKLTPSYIGIRGTRSGQVLIDVDILSGTNTCSAIHCGVGAPLSYEDACAHSQAMRLVKKWNFDLRYNPEVMTIFADGTYKVNWQRYDELRAERHGQ